MRLPGDHINIQKTKISLVYGIAQLLNIYSILLIGKNYSTDQYGIYVLVSSLAGIIITFSNGKYHNNIISSKLDVQKKQLVWLSLIITFSINLLFLLILFLIPLLLPEYNYLDDHLFHLSIIVWISLYCLLAGLNILTDAILNDKERYLQMSFGRLVKALFFLGGIMLLDHYGWRGLLFSIFLGQLFQFLFNGISLYKYIYNYFPNKTELISSSKEFVSSPKYNILLSLLISSTDYIVYSIIRYFWGIGFLGSFSLAEKIIKLPVALIGQPLSEQFFKKTARLYNFNYIKDLKKQCLKYLNTGFMLLIIPMVIMFFFSDRIIGEFFPAQWKDVGWIASILSPVMLFYFIIASWRSLSIVLKIQKQHFRVELICFASLCAIIAIVGYTGLNEHQLVVWKLIAEISLSIGLIYWFYNRINQLLKEPFKENTEV